MSGFYSGEQLKRLSHLFEGVVELFDNAPFYLSKPSGEVTNAEHIHTAAPAGDGYQFHLTEWVLPSGLVADRYLYLARPNDGGLKYSDFLQDAALGRNAKGTLEYTGLKGSVNEILFLDKMESLASTPPSPERIVQLNEQLRLSI